MTSLARNHFAPHQRNWKFAVGTSEENRRRRRVVREKGKKGRNLEWKWGERERERENLSKSLSPTYRKEGCTSKNTLVCMHIGVRTYSHVTGKRTPF